MNPTDKQLRGLAERTARDVLHAARILGYPDVRATDLIYHALRTARNMHAHVAKYVDDVLTDECQKCGEDIRSDVHIRG